MYWLFVLLRQAGNEKWNHPYKPSPVVSFKGTPGFIPTFPSTSHFVSLLAKQFHKMASPFQAAMGAGSRFSDLAIGFTLREMCEYSTISAHIVFEKHVPGLLSSILHQ